MHITHTHNLEVDLTEACLYVVCFRTKDPMPQRCWLSPEPSAGSAQLRHKDRWCFLNGSCDAGPLSPQRVYDTRAQGPGTRPQLLRLENKRVKNTRSLKSRPALKPPVLWGSQAGGPARHPDDSLGPTPHPTLPTRRKRNHKPRPEWAQVSTPKPGFPPEREGRADRDTSGTLCNHCK